MAGSRALVGIALLLSACQEGALTQLRSALEAPSEVDIGRLAPGLSFDSAVPIRNIGAAEAGGAALRIRDVRIEPEVEGLSFLDAPSVLVSGGEGEVHIRFAPLLLGTREARLVIDTDSDATPTVVVRLLGEVIDEALLLESPFDFGAVRLGDTRERALEVTNGVSIPLELRIPVDGSGQPRLLGEGFALDPSTLDSEGLWITLEPGATASLPLRFTPVADGRFEGQLSFDVCPGGACRRRVVLRGEGVQTALRCGPSPLDMGSLRPGGVRSEVVTCENPTHRTLEIISTSMLGPDAPRFSIYGAPGSLSPGGTADLTIEAQPLPEDRGRLLQPSLFVEAQAPNGPRESILVPVRLQVARAELEVLPGRLAFGRVPVGVEVSRSVVLVNGGDRPVSVAGAQVAAGTPFTGAMSRRTLLPGETVVIPVTVQAGAAGTFASTLDIDVDDAEIEDVVVSLEATALLLPPCRVTVTPGHLSFGFVGLGETRRRAVGVTNVAPYDCLLREPRVNGDVFSAVPLDDVDVVLPPGGRMRLEVDATPGQAGEHRGELSFLVSDPLQPRRVVSLSLISGESALRVDPDRIDFGGRRPGCESAARSVWIRNQGTAQVGIASIRLDPGPFLLSAPSGLPIPTGPVAMLGGGQSIELELRYAPTITGPELPHLLYVQRDGFGEMLTVELLGAGVEGEVIDRHQQGPAGSVDVLFVIDNSLSMEREQANVIANAGRFLEVLEAAGADYQLAVVSTDMEGGASGGCPMTPDRPAGLAEGGCGYFAEGDGAAAHPSWRIVDAGDAPSPREAFARVANLGLGGSAREAGLRAAATALGGGPARGHNLGFARPAAHLAVIFISDEEDQSDLSVDDFSGRLTALRGAAALERTSVSAVVTTGAACGGVDTGLRYQALTSRFGGLVRSICSSDWSALVTDLAERALGIRARFPLRSRPATGTLEVRVNGQLEPELVGPTQRRRWTLVEDAVVFEPDALPPPGAEVELHYRPDCP